ncbi:MAG: beta-lactamase family protein [Kiritimatiellae bacterium]|nr:beta-lactamase family protein [Kiritimatiellia bacterium]
MKMQKITVMLGLAAALAGCCTCNCPKDSGTTFARDALQKYVDSGELPGAVNVFYKDGVQETCCIGYADVDAKRPISLDDVYMQCSQTKGFCGVTIAMLVEEGKITLDDPVSKYLPEFKELWVEKKNEDGSRTLVKAKNELTVRMVMNHTGGFPFELPNGIAMGGWSRRMPLRSVAATAASQPIAFEPGTKAQYSNVGIDIGAAVVEIVTGKRWEDFLKERVLEPLGMKDSGFWPTDAQLARKIELYEIKDGQPAQWQKQADWMQRPYNDDRVFSSAGAGLWTTARDQLKFYKMLMNLGVGENGVRILKEETVKSILAVSTRPKGKTADGKDFGGYSLGLSAPVTDSDDAWFGHGGAWGTNCSVNWHKKALKLWAVQERGGKRPWNKDRDEAAGKFFKHIVDNAGVDAYTGRLK